MSSFTCVPDITGFFGREGRQGMNMVCGRRDIGGEQPDDLTHAAGARLETTRSSELEACFPPI